MSERWELVLHEDALQVILAVRGNERVRLMNGLQPLAQNPHQKGEARGISPEGRPYQIKYIGRFGVAYWPDEFVKELRITSIEIRR